MGITAIGLAVAVLAVLIAVALYYGHKRAQHATESFASPPWVISTLDPINQRRFYFDTQPSAGGKNLVVPATDVMQHWSVTGDAATGAKISVWFLDFGIGIGISRFPGCMMPGADEIPYLGADCSSASALWKIPGWASGTSAIQHAATGKYLMYGNSGFIIADTTTPSLFTFTRG